MSTGNPHLDGNVHRKRERTASLESIECRSAKKARSGPHHQLSCKTINPNATSFPRQSTRRRAVTDVGHNTKQDLLDLRTSQECLSLPHSPLPSTNSPQRLPLTEESLRLLDNSCPYSGSKKSEMSTTYPSLGTSPSDKAINAYDTDYPSALGIRQASFAKIYLNERPPGVDELWTALLARRKSPEPDEASIQEVRQGIEEAKTEQATVVRILPTVIPIGALTRSSTACSVTDMMWKSVLNPDLKPSLTAPKPNVTIGWRSDVFEDFPKACASLATFVSPVINANELAWPFFTVEAKGEKGTRRVSRLQNLHNGAVMLSNLYALKQKCKREETFFNKVHVMGVEIFEGCVQLSCYWATRSRTGEIKYRGDILQAWTLIDVHGHQYKQARLCIRNAIDWVQDQAQKWIRSDLQAVEDMLVDVSLSEIPLPISRSVRSRVQNGRVSKATRTTSQGTHSGSLPIPQ